MPFFLMYRAVAGNDIFNCTKAKSTKRYLTKNLKVTSTASIQSLLTQPRSFNPLLFLLFFYDLPRVGNVVLIRYV